MKKTNGAALTGTGWNLETMLYNPPRPFQKPIGLLRQPNGCDSYVYEITNITNNMKYIGFHKEGNDIYTTSSTSKEFSEYIQDGDPNTLKYEILFWGSVKECQQYEWELLKSVDAAKSPRYYNKWNGKPGVRKLDLEFVNKLQDEVDDIRTYKNLKKHILLSISNVKKMALEALYSIPTIQIRELQIDNENLQKIIDRIKNGIGSPDMPVVLEDITYKGVHYPQILISGNHTRTAMWKARKLNRGYTSNTQIEYLAIPSELTQSLQDSEVDMLGNNLNADYNVGKPFSVKDGVKECLGHHKMGHSWKTAEMKNRMMRLGLTSNQVLTVFHRTETAIIKEDWKSMGRVVYDYTNSDKNKGDLEKAASAFRNKDDDMFVTTLSSGNPHWYRILKSYFIEQFHRIKEGKTPQSKIKLVVYHTNTKSQDEWPRLFGELVMSQNIPNQIDGYIFTPSELDTLMGLVNYPDVTYYEMPMWGNQVQASQAA